ncbi:type IV pilin protein [Azohydromonas sediminis]|uniref:type IV pilin protein n=1 Tax=Azohydromonas sediminis TaxID=2259674 RepID=UPI000E64B664|nr:type IV pilin protein [Azohydromonas sediminis]
MAAPRARGFTLVELLIATAVVGLLAAVAWPAYRGHVEHARRADAAAALLKLELAQARFRAHHGLYTRDLRALGQSAHVGADGRWRLEVADVHAEGYTARAVAAAASGGDCDVLTLEVDGLHARRGPAPRCWGR